MPADRVVEAFDGVEDRQPRGVPRLERVTVDELLPDRREEALGGGDAPRKLRAAFVDWAYETEPLDERGSLRQQVVFYKGRFHNLNWLVGRLWECTEPMPVYLCEQLAMESGSTYADGVRSVRAPLKA